MHVMGMQVCVHKWVPGNRQGRVAMISSGGSEHEASEQAQIVHPLFFLPTEGITRQFFCFSFSYSFYLRSQLACDHTVHRLMKQTLKLKKKKELLSFSLFLRPQSVLRGLGESHAHAPVDKEASPPPLSDKGIDSPMPCLPIYHLRQVIAIVRKPL